MTPTPRPHPLRLLVQRLGGTATVAAATGISVPYLSMMMRDERTMSRQLLTRLREAGVDVDHLLADVATYRVERQREAQAVLAELAKEAVAS